MASSALELTTRPHLARLARADLLAAGFMLLVMLVVRGIWFGDPVAGFDEQLYSFIGWRLSHGELPYVSWWDRKPFGLFALFALAHELMGPGPIAYQIMASAFAITGAGFVYALARELADRFTAAIAGALYLILTAAYGSYSGQSEIFFLPIMLGMVWLLRDPGHARFGSRALWAMLLGGLALEVKYTVLPQCILLGGWTLWWRWRDHRSLGKLAIDVVTYAGLGVLPTALVGLFYAMDGHFGAFFFANFVSFFDRLGAPQGRWTSSFWVGVAPLELLAFGGLYCAWRMRPPSNRRLFTLFVLWCASSLATVVLPGTVYLYYYAALVPSTVLVALPMMNWPGKLKYMPAVALFVGAGILLDLPVRYPMSIAEHHAADRLAAAIAPHVGSSSDCLWVYDGPTALYRMSGSCVLTRFVYPDHLNNALETNALGVSQSGEVARILAAKPGVIVTANKPVTVQNLTVQHLVRADLAKHYRKLLTVPMHHRHITAWVRIGS